MMASRGTFKPGLFDIGLNIEKKLGRHYLDIDMKQLIYYIEIEPHYIEPAIRNLQAVMLFHIDLGQTRARLMLEDLIAKYPYELNALADLIHVYKKMGREKDATKYKERLETHKYDPLYQAQSILGQANALTFDSADDHNKNPAVLLKDSWRLLNMTDNHTEQVMKANILVVEAYNIVKVIPETAHEKKTKAKEKAIEKFEKGIEKLEELKRPNIEILAWKHNLAIARGRLDTWRNRRDDGIDIRSENCIKALEAHSDVIDNLSSVENLEESLRKYIARSSIYFVQLYISRERYIDKAQLPESVKNKVQNLDDLADKAKQICPNDHIVLQRYGRLKSNKKQYLEAIPIFDECIRLLPDKDLNWFSYASRRDAYYFYAKKLKKETSGKDKINKYLKLAYEDGEMCLQSKCTQYCMLHMAGICFERAMPNKDSDVSFFCQNIDFIYKALEIIHETLNKRDINKPMIYAKFGKYYPFIGEYRKSIESIKMALELNHWNKKYPIFSDLCKSFLLFYKESNDRNLLSEFRFMLKEATKMDCRNWVADALKMMRNKLPIMLSDLIENMIEWDAKGCKNIIRQTLQLIDVRDTVKKRFETKLQEENNKESDVNGPAEIQVRESSESFKYDFFVLHSEQDKEWVNCMLRPRLEDYQDEIKFRGCFPSRDFKPGERRIESMLEGMEKSRKILIILTPNNCQDNWMKYFKGQAIISCVESKIKEKAIILIIQEKCKIPDKLKNFVPINFSEKSNWELLRMSLTVNMDSMVELEKKTAALDCSSLED